MPRGLADLATSAVRTAEALPGAQRRGVQQSALFTTRIIREKIRTATGDMRLSGVGKRGAKVGAKFDVKGTANPSALITATGPLHLIERDTSPHTIYPRGQTLTARGRRRGGRKALKFGGRFSAYADHGGTRGKHPFERGWKQAAPQTSAIFQREVRSAVRRSW